jgi:hypothetical protein
MKTIRMECSLSIDLCYDMHWMDQESCQSQGPNEI